MTPKEFIQSNKIIVPDNIRLSDYNGNSHLLYDLMQEYALVKEKEAFEAGWEYGFHFASYGVATDRESRMEEDFEDYKKR